MRAVNAHTPNLTARWRNAGANGVFVRPASMAFASPVVVDSITRQADRKPRPSGFEPGGAP